MTRSNMVAVESRINRNDDDDDADDRTDCECKCGGDEKEEDTGSGDGCCGSINLVVMENAGYCWSLFSHAHTNQCYENTFDSQSGVRLSNEYSEYIYI